ncbi:MAG: oligoribonuclease [Elusimicrobia bacterium]|nr:oligoribonuclease [Elusimicrobiota bacterium]
MRDPRNLVWMDLEMTGLDPDRDTILEIATIITDSDLKILVEAPVMAIHQPEEVLARMDAWCVEHHGASGLTQRVKNSKTTMAEAEEATLAVIQKFCPEKVAPLCGNSIHQDRRFLVRYMPRINGYLHYRMIDVSSVKELVARWYPEDIRPHTKDHKHLAHDDVRESIDELDYYRQRVFKKLG